MALFALVHGACHGAWSWRRVEHHLRSWGHEVIAPTLTGCAERAHLIGPDVSLSTHIVDVTETLFFEDAWNVVLVGHSYSGMVVTGVAAAAGERILHLVYVDAYLPRDGESMMDLVAEPFRSLFAPEHDGWRIPAPTAEELGVADPVDRAWVDARLRHHTLAAYAERLRLATPPPHLAGTYVLCVPEAFGHMAERARAAAWPVYDLPGAHDPMIAAPETLARILDRCAADAGLVDPSAPLPVQRRDPPWARGSHRGG